MKIIAGNWKMNGSISGLHEMLTALQSVKTENKIILCVPFTMLNVRGEGAVCIGAQDVNKYDKGAYTGGVSAGMLADIGIKYVIVGHSECRLYNGDTNQVVCDKARQVMKNGMIPIICVGETMEEKQNGKTDEIIVSGVAESVPNDISGDIIVAYEPRWAIGAGIIPTDSEIEYAHDLIVKTLKKIGRLETPILYGASVKSNNAKQIMSIPHVDGVLVGGASLKPDDFIPIITSVE